MKQLKKFFIMGTTISALVILGACQNKETTSQTSKTSISEVAKETAMLVIQEDGKELSKKEVIFKEGETVYQALTEAFEVKDDKGFITSIDGHQQDEKEKKYWMYTVNGEMAPKGAIETKLAKNDEVVFNLQVLK